MSVRLQLKEAKSNQLSSASNLSSTSFIDYRPSTPELQSQVKETVFKMPEFLTFIKMICDHKNAEATNKEYQVSPAFRKEHGQLLMKIVQAIGAIDSTILKQNVLSHENILISCVFPEIQTLIDWVHEASQKDLIPKQRVFPGAIYLIPPLFTELDNWVNKDSKPSWKEFIIQLKNIINFYECFPKAYKNKHSIDKTKLIWDEYESKSKSLVDAFSQLLREDPRSEFVKVAGIFIKMFKIPCSFEDLKSSYEPVMIRLNAQNKLLELPWNTLCIDFDQNDRGLPKNETPCTEEELERYLKTSMSPAFIELFDYLEKWISLLTPVFPTLNNIILTADQQQFQSIQDLMSSLEQKQTTWKINRKNFYYFANSIKESKSLDVKGIEAFFNLKEYSSGLSKDLQRFKEELFAIKRKIKAKDSLDLVDEIIDKATITLDCINKITSQINSYDLYEADLKHDFRLKFVESLEQAESPSF